MANDHDYESDINNALLLQADEGITYPPPAGLATANDGAKGTTESAKASGLVRAARHSSPYAHFLVN